MVVAKIFMKSLVPTGGGKPNYSAIWKDDVVKQDAIAVGRAMAYLVVAILLVLYWMPERALLALVVLLASFALAVFTVLTQVDLPQTGKFQQADDWLWYRKKMTRDVTDPATGNLVTQNYESAPRVRQCRRVAMGVLVVAVLVGFIWGVSTERKLPNTAERATTTALGGSGDVDATPGVTPTTDVTTTTSASSVTTWPATTQPVLQCGAPKLIDIPVADQKMSTFSSVGVEVCEDNDWRAWGANAAPNSIKVTRAAEDVEYKYFQFSWQQKLWLIRIKK